MTFTKTNQFISYKICRLLWLLPLFLSNPVLTSVITLSFKAIFSLRGWKKR